MRRSYIHIDFSDAPYSIPDIVVLYDEESHRSFYEDAGIEDGGEFLRGSLYDVSSVEGVSTEEGTYTLVLSIDLSTDEHQGLPGIVDTLAHEAYHLAVLIFDFVGEDNPGEEIVAHLIGKLTGVILDELHIAGGLDWQATHQ